MKPNFALNFTDTSIALLHRTAKGWLKVGETPFDASDLEDALDYMRKTALGLEPGGFTTKLVIPASQILYTEIEVTGGSEAATRREIAAALESRTPYKADEIAFDWSGEGHGLKVAAAARETLDEAESFAVAHRFNPLGFVAIPDEGVFDGEPWFGETASAASLLAEGETVERDRTAISLIDDSARAARRKARAARQAAEAEAEAATKPAPPAAESPQPELALSQPAEPAPAAAAAPQEAPPAPAVAAPALSSSPAPAAPAKDEARAASEEQSEERTPAPAAAPPSPARDSRPDHAEFDRPAPFAAPAAPAARGPDVAITSITPLRADAEARAPEPVPPPAASAPPPAAALPEPAAPAPRSAPAPSGVPLTAAPRQPVPAPATPPAPAAAPPEADEAPFAHVPENASFPEADEELDLPPLPHLARSPTAPRQPAPVADNMIDDMAEDDLPPPPSGPVMAAYGRSRGSDAPPAAAPPLNNTAAGRNRPDAATLARAPRPAAAPISGPPAARPAAAAVPASAAAMAKGMAKGLGGLVTAPSIPGTRKARAKPAATPAAAAAASEAARSLGGGPFGARPARGKPRYLGLILTAILLLCLALVAAWSSFFLASGGDPQQTEQVQTADAGAVTGGTGGIDDEMLADGQDPEALADEAAAAPAEQAAAAPDGTAVDSESPAPVALLGTEDEIFLSAADAPPPAFDALSLPAPGTAAEAPPGEPMPPPPYGTVYRYDENGLLIPTVEGIPTPDGFMLYEGKPPKVPPARSAAAEAAATAASASAAAAAEPAPETAAPETAAEAAAAQEDGTAGPGNPSLVEATPVDEAPAAAAPAAAGPEAQPDPELADRRPRARPEGLVPDEDAALDAPEGAAAADFAGLRPRARPASVETAAGTARAETAAASLAGEEAVVQLASAAAPSAGLSAEEAANPSLLTISRRPAARPRDFSRAVEAAVAAAVRAPDPAPEAAPAPKSAAKAPEAKPDEADEIDEPEVASAPAPKIPTKASVAKQATFTKAINLSKINLIGVYGTQSNRHALVRLANGKYRKVSVGDKIDGGQVKAITANEVRYQKGGRLLALTMPKG